MKNNKQGFLSYLLLIILAITTLYYFKIDLRGIFDGFTNSYKNYFIDAKDKMKDVNFKDLLPDPSKR